MLPSPLFIIGIAGGTASGKTTLAELLLKHSAPGSTSAIYVDSYYRAQDDKPLRERALLNYDHPDSLDFDYLLQHLEELKKGCSVTVPEYDYTQYTRSNRGVLVTPSKLLIVEGILSLHPPELRKTYDLKIYVETPDQLRFARRLERDIRERGRSRESVLKQWNETVHPMHTAYCEPTKLFADMVLDGEALNEEIVKNILSRACG